MARLVEDELRLQRAVLDVLTGRRQERATRDQERLVRAAAAYIALCREAASC